MGRFLRDVTFHGSIQSVPPSHLHYRIVGEEIVLHTHFHICELVDILLTLAYCVSALRKRRRTEQFYDNYLQILIKQINGANIRVE